MTQESLAHTFGSQPFRIRDAYAAGFTRGELRNRQLSQLYAGSRSLAPPGTSLRDRALAFVPHLRPGDRFSHITALALMGCPIHVSKNAPVNVESAASTPLRRRGVLGHRATPGSVTHELYTPELSEPSEASLFEIRTIPIAPPTTAARQAATQLPGRELVVALDHLLRDDALHYDPTVAVEPDELLAMVDASRGARGIQRFRIAVELARVGAASRMETLTRLIAEQAGLRDLTLQYVLNDQAGNLIGRFDLADEYSRSLFEYDGEQHRLNRRQYLRDLQRLDAARAAGWRPFRVHAEDVLEQPGSTGLRMLAHTGRQAQPLTTALAAFIEERAPEDSAFR